MKTIEVESIIRFNLVDLYEYCKKPNDPDLVKTNLKYSKIDTLINYLSDITGSSDAKEFLIANIKFFDMISTELDIKESYGYTIKFPYFDIEESKYMYLTIYIEENDKREYDLAIKYITFNKVNLS